MLQPFIGFQPVESANVPKVRPEKPHRLKKTFGTVYFWGSTLRVLRAVLLDGSTRVKSAPHPTP